MMNLSLMVLMLIYGIIKIKNKMNFTILVSFAFPFLAYLWLVFYFINSIYTVIAISGFFYLFVTSKVYITYCKKYVEVTELDNMEEDNKII